MKHQIKNIIWFFIFSLNLTFFRPASVLANTPRLVFAAYLQTLPTYGISVESFKREIREAQALGIDGFVYYVQAWNLNRKKAPAIFTAADELNFKMIVGIDSTLVMSNPKSGPALAVDAIKKAVKHPSYYRYNNRPLVLTWRGEQQDLTFWKDNLIFPLRQAGINIIFMPYFSIQVPNLPINNWAWPNWFVSLADGFNYFGAARPPYLSIKYEEQLASYLKSLNKLYMAGVSPYYFRARHSSSVRDYVEYRGGEGMAEIWKSIINVQKPNWVLISTWNDFTESYISPVDVTNPKVLPQFCGEFCQQARLLMRQHVGYAKLMKYFITWYKTGSQPPIKNDSIYYFYRIHPKNLVATNEPNDIRTHGPYGTSWLDKDGSHANIIDAIYISTILKSPATLVVKSGNTTIVKNIGSGLKQTEVPFKPGRQIFELRRNGKSILKTEGEQILDKISVYNFIPTSGYAFAKNDQLNSNPNDLNFDGKIDIKDYQILISKFGNPYTIYDYNRLLSNYGSRN